jgi:hypothetical protein
MEHTDWLYQGFDAGQAQFLMVTAITHHRFSSPIWGEHEVRKLQRELAEIEVAGARIGAPRPARRRLTWPSIRRASRRPSRCARNSRRALLNAWLGLP